MPRDDFFIEKFQKISRFIIGDEGEYLVFGILIDELRRREVPDGESQLAVDFV